MELPTCPWPNGLGFDVLEADLEHEVWTHREGCVLVRTDHPEHGPDRYLRIDLGAYLIPPSPTEMVRLCQRDGAFVDGVAAAAGQG